MSTEPTPISTRTRGPLSAPSIRFALLGFVMLAVALTTLITVVKDWSAAADPMTFVGGHAWQLAGIVVGLVLVVTGLVKGIRR